MTTIIYAYTKNRKAFIGKTKNPDHRKWHYRFADWNYKVLDTVDTGYRKGIQKYINAWVELYSSWGYTIISKQKINNTTSQNTIDPQVLEEQWYEDFRNELQEINSNL